MYFQTLRRAVCSGAANFASCSDHVVPAYLSTFVHCGKHKRPIANPHCIINGGGISLLQAGDDTSSYRIIARIHLELQWASICRQSPELMQKVQTLETAMKRQSLASRKRHAKLN